MGFDTLLLLLRDTYRTGYLAGWCDGTGGRLAHVVGPEAEQMLDGIRMVQ